jgi:hypothetical protein
MGIRVEEKSPKNQAFSFGSSNHFEGYNKPLKLEGLLPF